MEGIEIGAIILVVATVITVGGVYFSKKLTSNQTNSD